MVSRQHLARGIAFRTFLTDHISRVLRLSTAGTCTGQEAHTATTNLAHKFSKLVHKVPVGALESEKPLEQPTAASGSAGANCSRKDSAKSVVGAMDAFMKPKSTMHGPSDDSVATGATGVAAETAPHRSKVCAVGSPQFLRIASSVVVVV